VSPHHPRTRWAVWSADGPQWLFKRNCSLSPAQTLQCVAGLGLLSLLVAGFFWSMGAVWVLPFTVAELCAVTLAFGWYARHATDHECARLQAAHLLLEWESGGRQQRLSFDRSEVRVDMPDGPRGLIVVSAHGHRMVFGRFVRADARAALAQEIRRAVRGV
jgi:uncharacterized membrane protein